MHKIEFKSEKLARYGIVVAGDIQELVKMMNEIDDGWYPLGGPFQRINDFGKLPLVCQAVVREPKHSLWKLTVNGVEFVQKDSTTDAATSS